MGRIPATEGRNTPVTPRILSGLLLMTCVISAPATAQVPLSSESAVEKGRQVFEQMKCLLCHSVDGKGGKLSVPLDDVALRRREDAMRRILLDPAKELANSKAKVKMPTFPFKDGELDALVAYLQTLRKAPPK
jgi:cytochrome c2